MSSGLLLPSIPPTSGIRPTLKQRTNSSPLVIQSSQRHHTLSSKAQANPRALHNVKKKWLNQDLYLSENGFKADLKLFKLDDQVRLFFARKKSMYRSRLAKEFYSYIAQGACERSP